MEEAGKLAVKTQETLAKELDKFELTSFEKIQILNTLPTNEIILFLVGKKYFYSLILLLKAHRELSREVI